MPHMHKCAYIGIQDVLPEQKVTDSDLDPLIRQHGGQNCCIYFSRQKLGGIVPW